MRAVMHWLVLCSILGVLLGPTAVFSGCADLAADGEDVVVMSDDEGVKVATPQEGDLIVTQADYPDPQVRLKAAVQASLDQTQAAIAAGGDPDRQVEVWVEIVDPDDFGGQTLDCAITTLNAPDFQIGDMYRDGEDEDVVGNVRYGDLEPWLKYRVDPIWL